MLFTRSIVALALCQASCGFVQYVGTRPFGRALTSAYSSGVLEEEVRSPPQVQDPEEEHIASENTAVRAPLKFIGPYPCLGLRFPHLATSSQRERNVTGVSLDFVLDTAANTNTINGQVAQELKLDVVGEALPGFGAGGAIPGASTFMLGDAQLEGVFDQAEQDENSNEENETYEESDSELVEEDGIKDEPFLFMSNLSASALPVANPATAGLLSLAFFNCFEGGVEFYWGQQSDPLEQPSVTFYGKDDEKVENILRNMSRVPVQSLPVTNLPSVNVRINGVEIPALFDTGSPVTVLNAKAAEKAGIQTVQLSKPDTGKNPFAAVAGKFKAANERAQAAQKGDLLMVGGSNGQPVDLLKATSAADIAFVGNEEEELVEFGRDARVYVGDLPGLAAMNAIGVDSPPAIVLGMDVIRSRPRLFFRARTNELFF